MKNVCTVLMYPVCKSPQTQQSVILSILIIKQVVPDGLGGSRTWPNEVFEEKLTSARFLHIVL